MGGRALVAKLEAIDRRRVELMDELAALDAAALAARPAPGKWSINEIVEHLVLAERAMLRAVSGESEPRVRRRRLKHLVLYQVVMFVLRFDIPVKVPARSMVPRGETTLAELRREWDRNHEELRAYAASLDAAGVRQAVFVHPVSGPMTPRQAVAVLDVHMRRHFRQIRRRLRAREHAGGVAA